MSKKEKKFSQKLQEFKKSVDKSGYSSRQAFKDLTDLLYGELVDEKKTAKKTKTKTKTEKG